jgi:hypothetical protein
MTPLISAAFVKSKLSFGAALKDKTNPFYKSKYADLANYIDAVEPALLANGIALIQETFDHPDGITVETVLLHESGETIRGGKLFMPADKKDAQGFGKALTYARRYSLAATCCVASEDDDGNSASAPSDHFAKAAQAALVKADVPMGSITPVVKAQQSTQGFTKVTISGSTAVKPVA